jgi:hypothetical protein
MASEQEYQDLYDRVAALRETMVSQLASDLIQNPPLAAEITKQIDELLAAVEKADREAPTPPDQGLAALVGLGPEAAAQLGQTRIPPAVQPYEETVTSERLIAVGDLYYIYQHEKIGVFSAVLKLRELFKAGTIRLSSGAGAYGMYKYDRRQVLRYARNDRMQAYRRVFGYTQATPPAGAKPNRDFHNLFSYFVTQVAKFFRDKRVSEVIRPRVTDPSFGSIAVVRRAGLDLRNNLKHASYGHINVLRVEVLQLLDEAFRVLGQDDIRKLFGADNAWDVIEEVMKRYLAHPQINASQRNRMASAGRDILRWLAQAHILNANRAEFEALLLQIADEAEEWLTSAEVLGIVRPAAKTPVRRNGRPPAQARKAEREFELW